MKTDPNRITDKTRLIARKPGRYVVESVPGSGKTELAVKVARALPGDKLIITLQNRCVDEFNSRLKKTGSLDEATTIHKLGLSLVRLEHKALGFSAPVQSWGDTEQQTGRNFIEFARSFNELPITAEQLWRLYKSHCAWGGSYEENAGRVGIAWKGRYNRPVNQALIGWAEHKRSHNRVDFYDMILLPLQVFKRTRLQAFVRQHTAIICDEIQDCSRMQLELIVALMKLVPTSVLVGDRMQSIFGFSGGIGEPFDYLRCRVETTTLRMDYSLRLTREVADLAQFVTHQHYPGFKIKTTRSGLKPTVRLHDDRLFQYRDVALKIGRLLDEGVDPGEIVVIARCNASLRMMGDALSRRNIHYHRELQGKEGERITRLHRGFRTFLGALVKNDERSAARYLQEHTTLSQIKIKRLIKAGRVGLMKNEKIPAKELARVKKCLYTVIDCQGINETEVLLRVYQDSFGGRVNSLDPNGLLRSLKILGINLTRMKPAHALKVLENVEFGEKDNQPGVNLLTIHKAKGGGWKYVFVIDVHEGALPHFKSHDSIEELRLLFVAITRSSKALFVSGHTQELCASMIEGKLEDWGSVTTRYGDDIIVTRRTTKGDIKIGRQRSEHKGLGVMARKMCRFLNRRGLHRVADITSVKAGAGGSQR